MTGLAIKDVEFNGATLRAAQDTENIIWVGVAWVCQGLGLTKGQMQNERKKIQTDEVLSQGERNFVLPTEGGNQESLCIKLDFLPLWLAKIHITPKMKRENPQLVENLITYQLKAKDVLAEAFLYNNIIKEETNPSILEYEHKIDRLESKIDKMYEDIGTLAKMFLDWKETADKRTLPVLTDRNTSWKSSMYEKMDRICANTSDFHKRADVMKWIYRYINKNYGVVWDQEVSEYKERNKTHILPSTIDVVQDKPIIKSIFESVLADLEYKYCKPVINTADQTRWIDQIVEPLIKKYDDHSTSSMVTYRKIYRRMNKNGKIGWNNMTTRYINQYGRKPTRKELIENRPTLRKKFSKQYMNLWKSKKENDIMGEEYKVIGKFLSPSKIAGEMVNMVIIKDNRGVCVLPEDEWKWVYGRQHRERWEKNNSVA